MLVLSRKLDEVILIGDDIRVTVTSISPRSVKLGIEAPKSVKVLRSELEATDGEDDDPAGAVGG